MTAVARHSAGPPRGPVFLAARAWLARLDAVTRWLVIGAMAVMTALVVAQVVFRYAFSSSIDWSEETARLAFVWAMFLALPHGIRAGVHVGIDALVVTLPQRAQDLIFRVTAFMGAALMAAIFWFATEVAIYTWPELMPTLNMTAAVYYIAVLVAAAHSILHLVLLGWGGAETWAKEPAQ